MSITTYRQAREYLEDLIKPYHVQRIEGLPDEYNNPLGRMKYLLELLGNPQQAFPSIVVSGTSGKSSTTYYIATMLIAAGYKVGMTISPHLIKLNERMQINNTQIPDNTLVLLLNEIIPAIEKMKISPIGAPSYFETLLALAFYYFAKKNVDIVVAEVGLEGKFDGTNVLDRLAFVYTNTSLDHTQILGETIEEIAHEGVSAIAKHPRHEKAPIVITGVSQPSVVAIFEKAVADVGVPLRLLGKEFSYMLTSTKTDGEIFSFTSSDFSLEQVYLPMKGEYQAENATLAIDTALQLKQFGFEVTKKAIINALKTAFFPGRFEMIDDTIILDGAHNPAKMQAFSTSLQEIYPQRKKIFVLGFKEGKNIAAMLETVLPYADTVVTTEFHSVTDMARNPSMQGDTVYDKVKAHPYLPKDCPVYKTLTAEEALAKAQALQQSYPESLVVITGSLYLVGEIRALIVDWQTL